MEVEEELDNLTKNVRRLYGLEAVTFQISGLNKHVCPRARILYFLLSEAFQYFFYTHSRVFFSSFPFHVELLKEMPSFQGHKKKPAYEKPAAILLT